VAVIQTKNTLRKIKMKQLEYVLSNDKEVLAFIRNHYPMYHMSNVFFRDVQFGIQKLFERRGEKLRYPDAERIAREFVGKLEKEKTLNRIDQQSWVLNYPEFKKPVVTPTAPAKPAASAAPAKSPAAGGVRQALPPLSGAKPAGAAPATATPTLPPLSSAKPVTSGKPTLPPLSSAKPVGGAKPTLPPLSSAKPVGAKPVAAVESPGAADAAVSQAEVVAEKSDVTPAPPQTGSPKVEPTKTATPSASPVAPPPGQRKPLPPLRGNYTPAGKK
jgi:hypothetical protein